MANVVLRVWLADRPGALGAVASRIGAVRGDLIAIDILERGGGRAIDELVVSIPNDVSLDLLVREVSEVDGVDVEEVRAAPEVLHDARLDALQTAALIVAEPTVAGVLERLVGQAALDFEAEWVAVVDTTAPQGPGVLASAGTPPVAAWLAAFLVGSRSAATASAGTGGPEDVAWAPLVRTDLAIVVGRVGRPLRARERRQLEALARIADHRWADLLAWSSRLSHPSAWSPAQPSDAPFSG